MDPRALQLVQKESRWGVGGCTYDRSSGVAGVEPLKLWAKVALPPSCLVGF